MKGQTIHSLLYAMDEDLVYICVLLSSNCLVMTVNLTNKQFLRKLNECIDFDLNFLITSLASSISSYPSNDEMIKNTIYKNV
jgi:hypothetical protein